MCGENNRTTPYRGGVQGSPPRVRGKPSGLSVFTIVIGITPACAGKTYYMGLWAGEIRDHPRVCGENMRIEWECLILEGSPPRVRGKLHLLAEALCRFGITPACAGKTVHGPDNEFAWRDHPRVCGENTLLFQSLRVQMGSPPRVRGKPINPLSSPATVGITPACAGKTFQAVYKQEPDRDHPRVCGENGFLNSSFATARGSPPRVRGKLDEFKAKRLALGITPACAGKTSTARPPHSPDRDHPRVCGENLGVQFSQSGVWGSPPRVRGKQVKKHD